MPRYLYPPQYQNLSGAPCFLPNPPQGQGAACVSPPLLAAQFTGANQEQLVATHNAGLQPGEKDWAFAFWFYETAIDEAWPIYVSKGNPDGSGGEWFFARNGTTENGRVTLRKGDNSGKLDIDITGGFTAGAWHLVCGWYDYSLDTFYAQIDNGTPVSNATGLVGMYAGTNDITFAKAQGGAWLTARMFCAAQWVGGFPDATARTALYNSGTPLAYCALPASLKTNLVSYWDMGEESGTRADSHGSNDLADTNTVTSVAWNS